MKKNQIRIVSDGTNCTTRVLGPDGKMLPNVAAVEILPIAADPPSLVEARVTFTNVSLDIVAQAEGDNYEPTS